MGASDIARGRPDRRAVTLVTEVGDASPFESPRQLMAYLGLVPGERSVRRGGITKAGNGRVRNVGRERLDVPAFAQGEAIPIGAGATEGA